ncbi:unnamed protein product, partial [Medioppia subpectinata]
DGYYNNQFIKISTIGSGGFGTVFKVKHRFNDKIYAVKRVPIDGFSEESKLKVLKEVNNLAKLVSKYVVKYYHSWFESNHLYIQMEFCPQSLKTLLKDKVIVFGRQPKDQMKVFEYFISCQIFKELLECVQYLHECNPRIIHRDLKPDNILIEHNVRCNRFVKLCDFGLATDHDMNRHTASRYDHTVCGTHGYIAPEVHSRKYNHLSDIYSLHVIGGELFGIDLQASKSFKATDPLLKTSIQCMYETLQQMMAIVWRQRPECRKVLAKYNEWSIHKNVVTNHKEFNNLYN